MSKKTAVEKAAAAMPAGAVPLRREKDAAPFEARTGAEQFQKVSDEGAGVWAFWPGNRNSKAVPDQGPFVGKCRESGREFIYFTHKRPDQSGVFIPAMLDLHPDTAAERVDERQAQAARLRDLCPQLADIIEARRIQVRG